MDARSTEPEATSRSKARSARSARCVAPLWWSPATAAILSSTGCGSTLHPLVVHGEPMDAVPDPSSEEFVGVRLRCRAGEAEELLCDPVLPSVPQIPPNELAPGGVLDKLFSDGVPRAVVGPEVAEQQGSRGELEDPPEGREVLLEVEGRGGRDRDEDLVRGEVETRRVPGVQGVVLLIEDREL